MYVDDIKLATWKVLVKGVDFQRECQISKDIVDNYRSMFESRISAEATEKLPETKASGKLDAETISS